MNVIPGAAHSELKMLGKQTCNDTDSGGHEPYNPTKVARSPMKLQKTAESRTYEAQESCKSPDLQFCPRVQSQERPETVCNTSYREKGFLKLC